MPPRPRLPGDQPPSTPFPFWALPKLVVDSEAGIIHNQATDRTVTRAENIDPFTYPALGARIDHLVKRLHMSPELADGYRSPDNAAHMIGLEGTDIGLLRFYNFSKLNIAERFAERFSFMSKPPSKRFPGGQVVAAMRSLDWDSPRYASDTAERHDKRFQGIFISETMQSLVLLHRGAYAPEMGGAPQPMAISFDDEPFIDSIFGEGAYGAGLTDVAFCSGMRRAGLADMSQGRLDRRVNSALGTLDFELGYHVVCAVEDMWSFGGGITVAGEQAFLRHRRALLTAGLEHKLAIAGDMAEVLTGLVHAEYAQGNPAPNRTISLNAMAMHFRQLIADVQALQVQYRSTYEALGYEVPANLVGITTVENPVDVRPPTDTPEAVGNLATAEAVEIDPAVSARVDELNTRIAAANARWTLKTSARNGAQLDKVVSVLMKEPPDRAPRGGGPLFEPMSRAEAQRFLDMTHQLAAMGGGKDLTKAQEALAKAVERENGLRAERLALLAEGVVLTDPEIVSVSAYVDQARADWQRHKLILTYVWPVNTRVATVANIEQLLFGEPTAKA